MTVNPRLQLAAIVSPQWLCFLQVCASTTNHEDLMDPILNQTSGCHKRCERIEPEDNEALKADSVLNFAFFLRGLSEKVAQRNWRFCIPI